MGPVRQKPAKPSFTNHFVGNTIVSAIEALHRKDDYAPSLSSAQLLSQLIFMFDRGWRGKRNNSTLWVPTEHNNKRRGSEIYIDSTHPSAAATILSDRQRFPFLHADILNATAEDSKDEWYRWLVDSVGLSTHPKLVHLTSEVGPERFQLHEDFRDIMRDQPTKVILCLLRDNWYQYSKYIENLESVAQDREPNVSRRKIREILASMPVRCTDGRTFPLSQTLLPLEPLLKVADGCVPFLDVPQPDDHKWRSTLHCLGVRFEDDMNFYITCLQGLKRVDQPSQARIRNLLEYIQARSGYDQEKVR